MNYAELEDLIVERLSPLVSPTLEVVPMPDTQEQFMRAVKHVRLTVAANESLFGDHKSASIITQEEKINPVVYIQSNRLRTNTGVYNAIAAVKLLLLGWQPEGYDKLALSSCKLSERPYENNIWTYALEFKTECYAIENAEEEVLAEALQLVTFESEYGESNTTLDEIDGGYAGTIYYEELDGGPAQFN